MKILADVFLLVILTLVVYGVAHLLDQPPTGVAAWAAFLLVGAMLVERTRQ